MSQVNKSALVPYSAEQMFKLVADVSSYQQFLPWCGASEEISRENNVVVGSVTISKGSIKKSFTTRNIFIENEQIEMTLVDGPFKTLHGFWIFKELKPGACKVSLDLDYEFSNKLLSLAIGPIFNQVANTMVDSFVERAVSVYGG